MSRPEPRDVARVIYTLPYLVKARQLLFVHAVDGINRNGGSCGINCDL